MDRFDKLCKHFYEVAEVAAESEDATKALHEILHQFNSNVPTMDTTINKVKRSSIDASSPNNDNEIHSPLWVKRKGRPPSKRKIYVVEKIVKRSRNQSNQRDDREATFENNTEIMRKHNESNICIESSIEAIESNTLVGGNTSFLDLLSQFSTTM
uniref:Uncharacterized protein LOC105852684 n=2 Tax=Cicer arietinum TaxID=3827 RepID=A0A1S3EGU6_CICAR|nr:uncharacterized protein LOC105852684 [Cicer arietinum]